MTPAFIKSIASWLFSQVIVALISWAIYYLLLSEVVGLSLNPLHWIGIVTIISLVFPAGRPAPVEKNGKDKNKSRVSIEDITNGRQGA